MANNYITTNEFKAAGILGISGDDYDSRMLKLIGVVSRQVDNHCGRFFYPKVDTKYFTGERVLLQRYKTEDEPGWANIGWLPLRGSERIRLPEDLIFVTTLKQDTDEDSTYSDTWATTDYELLPYDAQPTGGIDYARPYTGIEVNKRSDSNYTVFKYSQKAYQLIGTWGYCSVTEDSGFNLGAAIITVTATSITLDAEDLEVGLTLLIDSEQMFVSAVSTTTATVVRGVNGTTAATHLDDADIYYYKYPAPVMEAVMMQAARLWVRRTSSFSTSFVDTTQITSPSGLDKDVMELLTDLKKTSATVKMRVL